MAAPTRQVVVGRIGRPHGIRGEVSVEPRTDEPERRFAPGAVLSVEAPRGGPSTGRPDRLTVRDRRRHQERLLVTFAEIADRTAAESARGLVLLVDVPADERPDDPEEYYDHQIVGLRVETSAGEPVGELAGVQHGAAQDLLVVRRPTGAEVLVPFVSALVPLVDVEAGRIVVEDRPGLLVPLPDEEA